MSALHLIHNPAALEPALIRAGADDAILLIEDGVYLLLGDAARFAGRSIFALADDLRARKIEHEAAVEMAEFVALTVNHSPIVSWS